MSIPSSSSKLFEPIKVGRLDLQHRVVLAPLTRFKATQPGHVPVPVMKEYYSQRASAPGTLLITEATFIAPKAGGFKHVPGIWSEEQIAIWKEITDNVHAQGSYIYLQLWAIGRAAEPDVLASEDPSLPFVSASSIPLAGTTIAPRPLTIPEIQEYVQLYATAAENAVHKAGFDGVEIHGANGYLIDQFFQDVSNVRTDAYGGSIENRARFGLEVVDAVAKAVGADRVALRLSPWSPFQDMKMADPKPTFAYITKQLKEHHPDLAYLHVVEPRISGIVDSDGTDEESNDFLREIWAPKPFIAAGGYNRQTALAAMERAQHTGELLAFGRYFISNPDLVRKLKENLPLTKYDRAMFYIPGDWTGLGYTDYPFAPA
ncbi:FMN-linked oxidoreductase [Cylindrobasidium torrendii FP15055 ss-10]|uniref:FMN-linked oxidoreductase n=1 Tax=Cylindrobasidium torrendii FP15055 ss-10 TaxID=1314674 RepID=A0A0D7B374_9AGAR|nr:FMN-linked oxidoreductase [Cylindrobasidium torrendii FP15055 ss-10]